MSKNQKKVENTSVNWPCPEQANQGDALFCFEIPSLQLTPLFRSTHLGQVSHRQGDAPGWMSLGLGISFWQSPLSLTVLCPH